MIPDLSKLKMGARNWRLLGWLLYCAIREERDRLQFPKSICRIFSEQKARAWNSWCSTGLTLSVSISSGPRATPAKSQHAQHTHGELYENNTNNLQVRLRYATFTFLRVLS